MFEESIARIALRHGYYPRGFVYAFIEYCSSELVEATIRPTSTPNRDAEE
ncbi:MAG TPA: hypothetical protein VFW00_03690 [Rhodocyclaceae bacterium]|nr:hypothetical protein [Rhodocyclaceae bacterium]